jgi:anthranilate phosphoribosyltransferase
MFAPRHHGAMRHAIGPRRELGMRTIFNMLGPLTNPANAPRQIMGVYSKPLVEQMARVLQKLGSERAMVVYADDGMDEISVSSDTHVAELIDNEVKTYTIKPEQFSVDRSDVESLVVQGADESLQLIKSVFSGHAGAALDIIALNSGAAIYVAGLADTHLQGVDIARGMIADGHAAEKLEALIHCSNHC